MALATLQRKVGALEARIGTDQQCPECRGEGRLAIQRLGQPLVGGCPSCGKISVVLLVERVPGRYA